MIIKHHNINEEAQVLEELLSPKEDEENSYEEQEFDPSDYMTADEVREITDEIRENKERRNKTIALFVCGVLLVGFTVLGIMRYCKDNGIKLPVKEEIPVVNVTRVEQQCFETVEADKINGDYNTVLMGEDARDCTLVDRVYCQGLIVGKTYTIRANLVDKSNGAIMDSYEGQLVAVNEAGYYDVTFTLQAKNPGEYVVIEDINKGAET